MKENIERIEKQTEAMGGSAVERIKGQLGRLTQSTFLKPFLLLNLMINVGLEWGGFPALGKVWIFFCGITSMGALKA